MQIKETTIGLLVLIVLFCVMLFAGSKLPVEISQYRNWILLGLLIAIALWFVFFLIKKILAVRSAMAIEKKLKMQAADQIAGSRPDKAPELQSLASQMDEAIGALKTSKLGKGALYALPWYIIIGPPGTGKTTALQESGLNFPYTSKGKGKIQGVGGTRNCDWWFTDQGILLDTAGRYTTELEDRDEWLGFLDMLKKCRKDKPINGAIICMAVNEVLQSTDEQLEEYAKKIRDRLDELTKRLELVFPVYLLFTKCDLVNGFVEFFEDFTKADRSQVWGITLSYESQGSKNLQASFEEECKKFYERLALYRVQALATDRKIEKKRGIYSFPIEFALTQKRLSDFVGLLFRPNPYQESAILRGFYFTSGTQEGMPIDQIVNAIGASIPGIKDVSASFSGGNVDKKSYFINQLFTKVIFGDQNLARLSSRVVKTRRLVGLATVGLSVLGFIGITLLLIFSFIANQAVILGAGSAGDRMLSAEKEPANLEKNLKALDRLRSDIVDLESGSSFWRRFGLNRDTSLLKPMKQMYYRQIVRIFLDPLKKIMEDELRRRKEAKQPSADDLDELAKVLLAYRILSGDLPLDERDPTLHERVLGEARYCPVGSDGRTLWSYGASPSAPLPEELQTLCKRQLAFCMGKDRFPEVPKLRDPDQSLVYEINEKLSQLSWIEALYKKIKQVGERDNSTEYPAFDLDRLLPTAEGRQFMRMKEQKKVPGIFCQAAFTGYVKNAIANRSADLAREFERLKINKSAQQIENQIRGMYFDEHRALWDEFLGNVTVSEFGGVDEAFNALKVLATQGDTAISKLFERFYEIRVLTVDNKPIHQLSDNLKWAPEAFAAIQILRDGIQEFQDSAAAGRRFRILLDGPPGERDTKIEALSKLFTDAKKKLNSPIGGVDSQIRGKVENIFGAVLESTRTALQKEASHDINQSWEEDVLNIYKPKVESGYPFNREGKVDITFVDFKKLFHPKTGKFTKFKEDSAALTKNVGGQKLITPSLEFDRASKIAQEIGAVLWRGQDRVSVGFAIQITSVAVAISKVLVKFLYSQDEFNLAEKFEGGPKRAVVRWEEGKDAQDKSWETYVKITLDVGGGQIVTRMPYNPANQFPWGLFRLMDAMKIQPDANKLKEYNLSVSLSDNDPTKVMTFRVTCEEENNPFRPEFFNRLKFPKTVASVGGK